MIADDEEAVKKKTDKTCTDNLTVTLDKCDTKKPEKGDAEDPKPRIVLTIRSEKSSAKSNNMKIVSTEEKHEEVSPRRSSRTRGKWEWVCDSDTSVSPKKYKSASENDDSDTHTTKRSTSRRSKDTDNVVANAIARKEKLYDDITPQRSTRRQKPKVLEDVAAEKTEVRVKTRRSTKPAASEMGTKKKDDTDMEVVELDTDEEVPVPGNETQLKHLSELGLKAVVLDEEDEVGESGELDENEEIEADELEDDGDLYDETKGVDKIRYGYDSSSDEDYYCSVEASPSEQPRRSKRLCSSFTNDSDDSSPTPEDEQKAPRRRSSRLNVTTAGENDHNTRHKRKSNRSNAGDEVHSDEIENEEDSNPAGGDEGSEAACPADESTIVATCYCETPSNVYAAPEDLTEPVFCQAVEWCEGVRVGCSHGARRVCGSLAALERAGPRAPYVLLCALHLRHLRAHMCCPACGLFCTQGIFYQCSKGHLFHLECGLPYNDAKVRPGCPHCGVFSYRWQPANRDCYKVQLQMNCSNKRIFLPDQREQCTPAYLSFSTLSPSQLDNTPVIPEDLLPSTPIDLEQLCKKDRASASNGESAKKLCEAIVAGETLEELIPRIVSCKQLSASVWRERASCAHAAAARGHVRALHALRCAGAALDAVDRNMRTPLMHAVLALGDKKIKEKIKPSPNKDRAEEMEVEPEGEGEGVGEKADGKDDKTDVKDEDSEDRVNDEDLIKVIRYLVAAGCDVNLADCEGMTALHMAAQRGSADACSALVAAPDANLDARDAGGWTPLVWAAENDRADVVSLLVRRGADASSVDEEGNAAVHWCAAAGAACALLQLLRAAPTAHAACNAHADTPLHVAARQGHYACVVILLAQGAKTDVENSAGELPVDVCSGACHNAISLNMQMTLAVKDNIVRRKLLCSDISNGRETYPIPCVNEVDDEGAPEEFTYVTRHVTPHHIHLDNTVDTLQGCECKDGDCSAGGGGGGGECACVTLSVRRWYVRARLRPDFPYHDPPMLFECNHTCACNMKKCSNAVVSRARSLGATFCRTEVFRCGGARGWGLRLTQRVQRGSPVAAYCGELLPAAHADTRAADHYMFALDVKNDLLEQCIDKTQLCVDAAVYGSAARFINHSCRPNLAPVRVFTHCRDLRLPVVTLFATKDLQPGDELTFDYGDKFWSVKSKWMKCECGASSCRYPEKTEAEEAEA